MSTPPATPAAVSPRTPGAPKKEKKKRRATREQQQQHQSSPLPVPTSVSNPLTPAELRLLEAVKREFHNAIASICTAPAAAVEYRIASRLIYTFRRYTTQQALFSIVIAAFRRVRKNAFKNPDKFESKMTSLLTFVNVWLCTRIDTECLERSNGFISIISGLSRVTSEVVREKASRVMCSLIGVLRKKRNGAEETAAISYEYTRLPNQEPSTTIWTHKHETIAALFSVVEWRHFVAIPLADFQKKAWSDPMEHPNRALALRAFIERSNRIGDWVSTGILAQRAIKAKAHMLQAYILLAKHCFDAGNYNAASSILTGIHSGEVNRIKKLLNIEDKYIALFGWLDSRLTPLGNYVAYRAILAERIRSGKPCVPNVSVILKDLTFIEDANPDTNRDEGLEINTTKMDQLQDSYEIINRARMKPYPATKFDAAHAYALLVLERLPRLDAPERMLLSERVKPRALVPDSAEESHSSQSSPLPSRTASASVVTAPVDYPLGMDESSGSSRNEFVDMPLDLSSMSDKSFLGLPSASARTSVTGSDVRQEIV